MARWYVCQSVCQSCALFATSQTLTFTMLKMHLRHRANALLKFDNPINFGLSPTVMGKFFGHLQLPSEISGFPF